MMLNYNKRDVQRFYLGISQIGNPNQRLLWMRWRWLMPDDMPARVLRLLDLGNVVEDDLIKKLRKIPGAQIFDVASNGKQFETQTLGRPRQRSYRWRRAKLSGD